tara:strand:+ start:324 stop:545 length:222 start_codon:yes stop_codon:yes gene_type:complete
MYYKSDSIIEYFSSPEGLNNIVLVIIIFGAINAIFIAYALRNNFVQIKEQNQKRKLQKEKIDRLFPSPSSKDD